MNYGTWTKDKVGLITGASRGIGATSAKALAHHGTAAVINKLKGKDKAEELFGEIENWFKFATFIRTKPWLRRSNKYGGSARIHSSRIY